MTTMPRPFGILLLLAPLVGACALPHGPDHGLMPLEAMSIGAASALSNGHARTGLTLAAYSAGTSRIGSYASVRIDSIAGLDVLLNDTSRDSTDDGDGSDSLRFDEYQGAFVYSMGAVFRLTSELAVYGGGGIGNFYDRSIRNENGRDRAILRTIYWGGNLQSGVLWTLSPDFGLDVGYDTFDDSWRLAFVARW